jgi:hypothetical protein
VLVFVQAREGAEVDHSATVTPGQAQRASLRILRNAAPYSSRLGITANCAALTERAASPLIAGGLGQEWKGVPEEGN